ncbi:MAG: response regulator [Candidatus Micrarchaeota archaeon]|nr:response regulator [Candidatus Micrarchaeota archaeon]
MTKTILLVDDEADVRQSVQAVLESNGYKVIAAENGDQAMAKLRTAKPDLILLDIMMPGMPAKEVVARIKDVKIAYLSVVRVSEAEREELLGHPNVVDFITKPFELDDLLRRIKKILK